jgi:60 kDa SS-A/Ro ribonucleoprotein
MDSPLSARVAAVAMAMSVARIEPDWTIVAFSNADSDRKAWSPGDKNSRGGRFWGGQNGLTEVTISPRQRLDDIVRATSKIPMGGTDCALPVRWALAEKREFDVISIFTDSETWAGPVHVHQALRDYREKVNPQTRFVAAGMTSTDYTVADPSDPLSLNISGMDAAVPNMIAGFARGEF